jgi:hypothetical protein
MLVHYGNYEIEITEDAFFVGLIGGGQNDFSLWVDNLGKLEAEERERVETLRKDFEIAADKAVKLYREKDPQNWH